MNANTSKKKNSTANDTFERLKHLPLRLDSVDLDSVVVGPHCGDDYPTFQNVTVLYAEFHNGESLDEFELRELITKLHVIQPGRLY